MKANFTLFTAILACLAANSMAMVQDRSTQPPTIVPAPEIEQFDRIISPARRGNAQELERLLTLNEASVRQNRERYNSMHTRSLQYALNEAARNNHVDCIQLLLARGARINYNYGGTALYAAVQSQLAFIIGLEHCRSLAARQANLDFINFIGNVDCSQAIEQLIADDADPSIGIPTPLGLALATKGFFQTQLNAAQTQQIDAVIHTLQTHGAVLNPREAAEYCIRHNPSIKSMDQMINAYVGLLPINKRQQCDSIHKWTRRLATGGALIASPFAARYLLRYATANYQIKPSFTTWSLLGVTGLAGFAFAYFQLPNIAHLTYQLFNKMRRSSIVQSLRATTEQIHAANNDRTTNDALRWLLSTPLIAGTRQGNNCTVGHVGCTDIGRQCAHRIGLELVHR